MSQQPDQIEFTINSSQKPTPQWKDDGTNPRFRSYVQRSNPLKYLFFLFELRTFITAFKLSRQNKALNQHTISSLGWNEKSETLEERITRHMNNQKKKNPNKKPSFVFALLWVAKFKLILSILFEVILMFARVFSVYCCKELIEALQEFGGPSALAYKWAGTLAGVLLGAVFVEHHFYFLKTTLPVQIRGAIISLIYSKVSKLSVYTLNKLSLGKLVNIVANDVNVFERTGMFFPNLITGPIGIVAAAALLWIFFGPICLVGIGYVILSFPLQTFITKLSVRPRDKQNKVTDERVRITSEMIEGIRLLKMYTWELFFRDTITEIRNKEVKHLGHVHDLESLSRGIAFSTQALASFLIFMPYSLLGNDLEMSKAFPTFFLIGFLRTNAVFFLTMGMTFVAETKLLMERVSNILDSPDMAETIVEEPKDRENAIELDNFTAFWERDDLEPSADALVVNVKTENDKLHHHEAKPVLSDINLHIKKGSLNALVGKVGAGKSSFALAFTGEMPKTTGEIRFSGNVAYVEQEPTIFAGTIRDNILFGKEYDTEIYKRVIEGCNLVSDLKLFSNGDLSEVGEKGVNLSGGQKARIGLARAVYADADIYLLDDPLSAVDAKVAKSLFNNAIKGLLKEKTVILITHQVHFVKNLENIIILEEGKLLGYGSFATLRQQFPQIDKIFSHENQKAAGGQQAPMQSESDLGAVMQLETYNPNHNDRIEQASALVSEEDANAGQVTLKTYISLVKEMGGAFLAGIVFVLFLTNEFATIGFGRILAAWVGQEFSRNKSLAIMGGLTGYLIFIYILKNIMFSLMLLNASKNYHQKMLNRIVRNPVQFFDTNPLGRILNRFSNDVGVLDRFLPSTTIDVVDQSFFIGALIVTLGIIEPWLLLPIGIGAIMILLLLLGCYEAIKQSRKYELVSKSPLYSLFSATLSGIVIIRNYQQTLNFKKKFSGFVNDNTKGAVAFWTTSRFFGFYVDLIYLMTGIANIFIMTALTKDVGLTAFVYVLILSITSTLQYALRQAVQTHVLMASVQRIRTYIETPIEAGLSLPSDKEVEAKNWPQKGEIDFHKVYMRYRPNIDYVIRDLTLNAQPGEKIGCIGRTGAGKSSIIQILFRMIEIDNLGEDTKESHLDIDSVNTKLLGLHLLRKNISIIPQVPFIFSGTIRKNLDPLNQASDEQLWKALEEVGLKKQVESLDGQLYADMSNAASVFSVGQKQLICLARTLLKKAKILVLDEATANVDKQTDDFIQATIFKKFNDCTIFTIAHRLSTIANYDKVLVLDKGRKVEFDMPYKLLVEKIGDDKITNPTGHFASMVLNTGPKSSQQILNIAREKYFSERSSEVEMNA